VFFYEFYKFFFKNKLFYCVRSFFSLKKEQKTLAFFLILWYNGSRMTKKQSQRQQEILNIVVKDGNVEVSDLSTRLGVSQVTIRKDIDALVQNGVLERDRGKVRVASSDDIGNRLAYHYETKRKIACAAAKLINDGEVVMIESGSCCALLAEELALTRRGVTIITNSAFIAAYIRRKGEKGPGCKVILLGGDYQNESQVMTGPLVRECVQRFSPGKFFIGADGWTETTGFTGSDYLRVESVRDMAARTARVIVLTESEKFGRQGVVALFPQPHTYIKTVITDAKIPETAENFFKEHKIDVLKVEN
jgi:DeoR/GlpR family transcriptional regulator of sugar metabolism